MYEVFATAQTELGDRDRLEVRYPARKLYLLLFFVVGVVTCCAYGAWNMPLGWDNQHYFFISERVAAGVPPHISQFDPKHGLSMMLSGAAIRLGRVLGADDVRAARALSVAVTAASIALAWLLAEQLSNSYLVAHISALTMLSFAGFMQLGAMGARPKVFMVVFMFLSMVSVARNRPFQAGLFSSLCFLCWQPGILMLGGAVAGFALRPGSKKSLARVAAGAAIPYLLYESYFLYHGAFQEQLKQAYWFPARFLTGEFVSLENSLLRLRFRWERGFGDSNVLYIPFALAIVVAWGLAVLRPRRTWQFLKARPVWVQFCLCSHAAVAFTVYDQQGYADLLLILPFMAVSTGLLVAWPGARATSRLLGRARLALGTLCMAGLVVLAADGTRRFDYQVSLDQQYALGRELALLLQSGRTVYVVGPTHLLGFAHADNHINLGFYFRGVSEYLAYSGADASTFRPLREGMMPDIVLWSRGGLLGDDHWLDREYDLYRYKRVFKDITVWVRKASSIRREEMEPLLLTLEGMYGR